MAAVLHLGFDLVLVNVGIAGRAKFSLERYRYSGTANLVNKAKVNKRNVPS